MRAVPARMVPAPREGPEGLPQMQTPELAEEAMSDIFEMLKTSATLYNEGLKQGGRMTHESPFHEIKSGQEAKCLIDELPDKRIGMSKEDHAACPKCQPAPHTSRVYWLADYGGGQWFSVFGGNISDGIVARFPRRDEAEKFLSAINSHASDQKKIKALVEALERFMAFDGRYGELAGHERMDETDFAFNLENLRKQGREALHQAGE